MKKIILGMVFVLGVISIMSAKTARKSMGYLPDCNAAFTVCDNFTRVRAAEYTASSYEDEYAFFAECMSANGC